MKQSIFFHTCFFLLLATTGISAQSISYSLPQKVSPAIGAIEIIGQTDNGLLVTEQEKNLFSISCFSSNLSLLWKKNLPLKNKNDLVQKIFLLSDSLLIFYTESDKSMTTLHATKISFRAEAGNRHVLLDTLSRSSFYAVPELHFVAQPNSFSTLIYYEENDFSSKKSFRYLLVDKNEKIVMARHYFVSSLQEPALCSTVISVSNDLFFLFGENTAKNNNNDFPFEKLLLLTVSGSGKSTEVFIDNKETLIGYPTMKTDEINQCVLISSLYSVSPGIESKGVLFFSKQIIGDSVLANKFIPFTSEFLLSISGNSPPKKSDGFLHFKTKDIIVRADGGIIFLAESVSISTESFNNQGYGNFGVSTSMTINYYHFDDVLVMSFSSNGELEWNQVLRKRQQTEGDGGYYSSFNISIGSGKLNFIFNDMVNGDVNVSEYIVTPDGIKDRHELFNAERNGVMLIPRDGKQISLNETVMPSMVRNYFQLVKFTFDN